jgi:putative endopeptidase
MKKSSFVLVFIAIFTASLIAQAPAKPASAAKSKPAKAAEPKTAEPAKDANAPVLPYTPALETSFIDKSVDPCADLYTYACGGWTKQNPIPNDQASWSVYGKLADENYTFLKQILEKVSAPQTSGRTAAEQKIGDYYAACMDEAAIEKAGLNQLRPEFDQITNLKSVSELAPLVAHLHLITQGSGVMFGFGSEQDFKNSQSVIGGLGQGGIGLPDRDYYFDDTPKMKETREKYLAFIEQMLTLSGEPAAQAKTDAAAIFKIETALAKSSQTRVARRKPENVYHKVSPQELAAWAPDFDWNAYLQASGVPQVHEINVETPDFVKTLSALLKSEPLSDWKAYLRFHLVQNKANYLSKPFVDANFDFYSKYLRGVPQLLPRWKRCTRSIDNLLGEALGQAYVKYAFPPDAKARAKTMVDEIEKAMAEDINTLSWMSPATKKQALEKLRKLANKIGYPEKWRDYSTVNVRRNDYLGSANSAIAFESKRELNKIGKPVDRTEWGMTPPTVNAYYNPQMNDINFPAGVLQPPLFDAKLDDAPNYGDTGSTIGHELTHGFDDEGAQFDGEGNLRDWWSKEDKAEFEKRTSCVADQYAQYIIVDDIHINSRLTLGEDVADVGGLILAWMAWKDHTKNAKLAPMDGYTPEQRFFVGYTQQWCTNERDENKRVRAKTDPHSPAKYRVNGVVANMPEFQQAFSCKQGAPLAPEKRCRVW